jgi:methylenetetrahydrofolate reductase (NADPH)
MPATDVGARSELVVPRYEVMPFRSVEAQVSELAEPVRLTITTSPRHGVDHSLDFAERIADAGHALTLHVAARMVRSEQHLDEIVSRARDLGIDDLFVIGGDAPEPLGPFTAAGEVLDLVAAHPLRPAALGVGAYPEGHPLIAPETLDAALAAKARVATYLVTQLAFDAKALLRWLDGLRARGIELPLFVGAAGPVERRKLLEISMRIGVGPSLRYLRKQRGIASLFRSPTDSATRFRDDMAAHLDDPGRRLPGFHYFTFNELVETVRWHERSAAPAARTGA